jgi:hypothetical protein
VRLPGLWFLRSRKRAALSGLLLLILATLAWTYFFMKGQLTEVNILFIKAFHKQPTNLYFHSTKPDCTGGPLFNAFVKETKWEDPDTLYCKVVIPANCGAYFWLGNYRLEKGNTIILISHAYQREFLACGACPVDLEYKIQGLKKQAYEVVIEDQ